MRSAAGHVLFALVLTVLLSGCHRRTMPPPPAPEVVIRPESVSHAPFDSLLKAHVDAAGRVDYASLKRDSRLEAYLHTLASIDPSGLPVPDQVAFWINVYNAYTLHLIAMHYPVGSIREVTPVSMDGVRLYVPWLNSAFEFPFVRVGGMLYTLDAVEHDILRPRFEEPRIHFALVCAAVSCPPLRREAYTGDDLEEQLDEQALRFLKNPEMNRIPEDSETVALSLLFRWFQEDFGANEAAIQAYVAPYFNGDLRCRLEAGSFTVRYLEYNWALNGQL